MLLLDPPGDPQGRFWMRQMNAWLVFFLLIALITSILYVVQDRQPLPEPTEPPLEELMEEPDQSQSHFPATTLIFPGFHSMLSAHG